MCKAEIITFSCGHQIKMIRLIACTLFQCWSRSPRLIEDFKEIRDTGGLRCLKCRTLSNGDDGETEGARVRGGGNGDDGDESGWTGGCGYGNTGREDLMAFSNNGENSADGGNMGSKYDDGLGSNASLIHENDTAGKGEGTTMKKIVTRLNEVVLEGKENRSVGTVTNEKQDGLSGYRQQDITLTKSNSARANAHEEAIESQAEKKDLHEKTPEEATPSETGSIIDPPNHENRATSRDRREKGRDASGTSKPTSTGCFSISNSDENTQLLKNHLDQLSGENELLSDQMVGLMSALLELNTSKKRIEISSRPVLEIRDEAIDSLTEKLTGRMEEAEKRLSGYEGWTNGIYGLLEREQLDIGEMEELRKRYEGLKKSRADNLEEEFGRLRRHVNSDCDVILSALMVCEKWQDAGGNC